MWDSIFMAEMDNYSGINENFDTIKTLLNSIRAQGILNTSDVDKLLSGINAKLEKINTEEDIDLIKIFLSELKQNLEERHSILISKFGAIESLFSNLLKNSSEMPKSSDIKELFDIVATNLSVFSREVVAQKDTLTDITLRIDALRSDDSQKKDIIKNIAILKPDIERLNNGFDSIVISLNDNFKTIIKAISGMDKSEYFDRFSDALRNSEMSMNTILSALQVLDKKAGQFDESINNLATKGSIESAQKHLSELTLQNKELSANITDLSDKVLKIDTLADKIDASVNIIATLKAVLDEADDNRATVILEQLKNIESSISSIDSDEKFLNLRNSLEGILRNISESSLALEKNLNLSLEEVQKVALIIKSLDINVNFQNLIVALNRNELALKTHIDEVTQKITTLQDANITRVLNDLTTNADVLNTKLNQTQVSLSTLCEKNFNSVYEYIGDLKTALNQLDENSVSANNAIFSSITDRLTVFENSLRLSLDNQEKTVSDSTSQLFEYVENIKNLSSVLDYKMDSSVVEVGNIKREFTNLKSSIDDVLALDFVNTVKDLRVDLYASKQELVNTFETSNSDLSEKITNDLYGKYELLISKLDSVEDEFKKVQNYSLNNIKSILENISGSIVDVLSYVSESKTDSTDVIDSKIAEISASIKANSLDYIENVRDIVDVIRVQIDNNLKNISEETISVVKSIDSAIIDSAKDIKKDLSNSYSKILELQNSYKEIRGIIDENAIVANDNFTKVIESAEEVKIDFESNLSALKAVLLDKINDFKQQFTCENADKVSELKFAVENLYNKNVNDTNVILDELREKLGYFESEDANTRAATLAKILDNFVSVKDLLNTLNERSAKSSMELTNSVLDNIDKTQELITNLTNLSECNIIERADLILEHLSNINSLINDLNCKSEDNANTRYNSILENVKSTSDLMNTLSEKSEKQVQTGTDSIIEKINGVQTSINTSAIESEKSLVQKTNSIIDNIMMSKNQMTSLFGASDKVLADKTELILENISETRELLNSLSNVSNQNLSDKTTTILNNLELIKEFLNSLNEKHLNDLTSQLNSIKEELTSAKYLVSSLNEKSSDYLNSKIDIVLNEFSNLKSVIDKVDENIDSDMTHQLSIIESNFEALVSQVTILFDKSGQSLAEKINSEFASVTEMMNGVVTEKLELYKFKIEETFDSLQNNAVEQSKFLEEKIVELNSTLKTLWKECSQDNGLYLEQVASQLKCLLESNAKAASVDYELLREKLENYTESIDNNNKELVSELKTQLDDITKYINSVVEIQGQDFNTKTEDLLSLISKTGKDLSADTLALKTSIKEENNLIKDDIKNLSLENTEQLDTLKTKISECIEDISKKIDISSSENLNNVELVKSVLNEQIQNSSDNTKAIIDITQNTNEKLEKLESNIVEKQEESNTLSNSILSEVKSSTGSLTELATVLASAKGDILSLSKTVNSNRALLATFETGFNEKIESLKSLTAEISAGELQSLDNYINVISQLIETEKEQVVACKDLIVQLINNKLDALSKDVEKETDVIIAELIEQFDLLKKSQADEVVNLTSRMEEIVNAHIYNNIEDLKSYLDIKTDNSVLSSKLDNLKVEMSSSFEGVVTNLNKLLDAGDFSSAIADYRIANEILINSSIDSLNDKIKSFLSENFTLLTEALNGNSKVIEEKFALFDKKFIDTLVDKYEEIKILTNTQTDNFNKIEKYFDGIVADFNSLKNSFSAKIDSLVETVNNNALSTSNDIKALCESFEGLKSQISNKSFDEAFQASINKQIAGLEALISEQFNYIEDISELCTNNLPDVSELNTLVKHSVLTSINEFSNKIDALNIKESVSENLLQINSEIVEVENIIDKEFKQLKSDVITQILNIFNQISFVAEEEEILDYIQEKHDELITILSHIVTTSDEINNVKDNISVVDNKIDDLRDEINLINEKITAIISSEGDIDYVYSLQDLESDIANLRIVLNEMKADGRGEEFAELVASTNDIYQLVESIKSDLPTKNDFDSMAEDLLSISTRTNKLILASEESYKTLQDNLQDFKLVVDDLDERTKNFARESGIEKIDHKLNSINTMMVSGAKTNQVFNQVFEYLAEWVDKASVQINSISDKVETLDDIGQIKVMLADLKAESQDNSESLELIEALGTVFDKQAKKINSLEAKLDKIIVETTINNKNNIVDLSGMENVLNKFLVAMDEKMISQQNKINSLESKLETVLSIIDEKDTAMLTKKVGGMDRQIAKLNKSIEKIASHVVEK